MRSLFKFAGGGMNIQEEVGEELFGTSSFVEKIAMCFTHDLNSKLQSGAIIYWNEIVRDVHTIMNAWLYIKYTKG